MWATQAVQPDSATRRGEDGENASPWRDPRLQTERELMSEAESYQKTEVRNL